MKYKSTWFCLFAILMFALSLSAARAAGNQRIIETRLNEEGRRPEKALEAGNVGPDILHFTASGLEPGTAYTVYLTKKPASTVPSAQFIGEFKTNSYGFGRLLVTAPCVEIDRICPTRNSE